MLSKDQVNPLTLALKTWRCLPVPWPHSSLMWKYIERQGLGAHLGWCLLEDVFRWLLGREMRETSFFFYIRALNSIIRETTGYRSNPYGRWECCLWSESKYSLTSYQIFPWLTRPGLFTGSWGNAGMIYFPTILFKSMYAYMSICVSISYPCNWIESSLKGP